MLFLITFPPQPNFYLASDNNSGLQTDLSERPLNRPFSSPDCFHRHRKQPVAPFLNWVVPGPRSFRCSRGICLLASDKQLLWQSPRGVGFSGSRGMRGGGRGERGGIANKGSLHLRVTN